MEERFLNSELQIKIILKFWEKIIYNSGLNF